MKYNAEVKSIKGTGPAIEGSVQKIVTRARDGTSTTTEVQRHAPPYAITLTNGEVVMAETVVLAIGTQGNPNLMRCPGGDLPHVTYQLDDPYAVLDEHIVVVGAGDAGIENALGLAADPDAAQHRHHHQPLGRLLHCSRTRTSRRTAGGSEYRPHPDPDRNHHQGALSQATSCSTHATASSRSAARPGDQGGRTGLGSRSPRAFVEERIRCDRIIARIGSAPPRGIEGRRRLRHRICQQPTGSAFPTLSPQFESTAPGIFVIGALAGYPLIKHCMNQGYDVIEFINGNTDLKPADEPLLEAKFARAAGQAQRERLAGAAAHQYRHPERHDDAAAA